MRRVSLGVLRVLNFDLVLPWASSELRSVMKAL